MAQIEELVDLAEGEGAQQMGEGLDTWNCGAPGINWFMVYNHN